MNQSQNKMRIKMFKAGKMWMTAGVLALGLGVAGGTASVASADAAPAGATQVASTQGLQDGQYTAAFNILKTNNTTDSSVMQKMLAQPAQVTIKGDQATITLNFASSGSDLGSGDALSNMLKSWTFNGTAATKNGTSWSVTLPKDQLSSKIGMTVVYFQTESADLYLNNFTLVQADNSASQASASTAASTSAANSAAASTAAANSAAASTSASTSAAQTSTSAATGTNQAGLVDGLYNADFHVNKSGTNSASVMEKILTKPAKAVVKGDKVTLTFNFGGQGIFGFAGQAAASLLNSMTFNGVNATRDGANWTVTLPVSDLQKKINVGVNYFMSEKADLYVDKMNLVKADQPATAPTSTATSTSAAPSTSTAPTSTAPTSTSAGSQNFEQNKVYNVAYHMNKDGQTSASVMDKMFDKPAKAVFNSDGKTVTLSFTFSGGNGSGYGDGSALSNILKSWTFAGVPAVHNGNTWSVTLPVSAISGKIPMTVVYFQTEHADLYLDGFTKTGDSASDTFGQGTNGSTDTTMTPFGESDAVLQGGGLGFTNTSTGSKLGFGGSLPKTGVQSRVELHTLEGGTILAALGLSALSVAVARRREQEAR
ncbi:NEAT domain-containing protein [Lactobacillaceae bacterium L1_55_11]|nr:NEAT domain-containing protein [Lactobacillaceae bacterium L1_55_11]